MKEMLDGKKLKSYEGFVFGDEFKKCLYTSYEIEKCR